MSNILEIFQYLHCYRVNFFGFPTTRFSFICFGPPGPSPHYPPKLFIRNSAKIIEPFVYYSNCLFENEEKKKKKTVCKCCCFVFVALLALWLLLVGWLSCQLKPKHDLIIMKQFIWVSLSGE